MIKECPDPREVSEFFFRQLRTLKLANDSDPVTAKCLNSVASSSKFGLLFALVQGGFKVLSLENLLSVDEQDNRTIEENYKATFIRCQNLSLLSVNASQETLVVCTQSSSSLSFYNVSSFFSEGVNWKPFLTVPLKFNCTLCDLVWNPADQGLFAYCLSDGSLFVDNVADSKIKSIGYLPEADATVVYWSPKGKQLVVGQKNGAFAQFKPNLSKVKVVPPPQLEEGPVWVSSICWISSTSFAVVYVSGCSPYLFIVSSQKDAPVSYTNFYDVCLGNNHVPDQKYFLHLEPLWGILVCSSADSIEVAVLGDMPDWVQWDLKEDGKALLPGKDGATNPTGCTVMYSAQKRIVISESESYPPMPILFFLTNNGLLISFHMVNTKADALSLVYAPDASNCKKAVDADSCGSGGNITVKMTPLQPISVANAANKVASVSISNVLKPTINQVPPSQNTIAQVSITTGDKQPLLSEESKNESQMQNEQQVNKPGPSIQVSATPTSLLEGSKSALKPSGDSFMAAIFSEIQTFSKELSELKQLQEKAPCLDNAEEMAALKVFALNLENFQKEIAETMQSLSSDIFALKNVLLESFVMVEEACSRERRRYDHSYVTMLKERSLDPVTAKRMHQMRNYYQYLSMQLQEVNNKLDNDRVILLASKSRESSAVSSTEVIYKTIVNNQKVIHVLRKRLDVLSKKVEKKLLLETSKNNDKRRFKKKTTSEDLSALADRFLQVHMTSPEEKETLVSKKLPPKSQNILKEYLKDANVVAVRPTAVYSPSQSRLLSNSFKPLSAVEEKSTTLDILSHQKISDNEKVDPSVISKVISKPLSENNSMCTFSRGDNLKQVLTENQAPQNVVPEAYSLTSGTSIQDQPQSPKVTLESNGQLFSPEVKPVAVESKPISQSVAVAKNPIYCAFQQVANRNTQSVFSSISFSTPNTTSVSVTKPVSAFDLNASNSGILSFGSSTSVTPSLSAKPQVSLSFSSVNSGTLGFKPAASLPEKRENNVSISSSILTFKPVSVAKSNVNTIASPVTSTIKPELPANYEGNVSAASSGALSLSAKSSMNDEKANFDTKSLISMSLPGTTANLTNILSSPPAQNVPSFSQGVLSSLVLNELSVTSSKRNDSIISNTQAILTDRSDNTPKQPIVSTTPSLFLSSSTVANETITSTIPTSIPETTLAADCITSPAPVTATTGTAVSSTETSFGIPISSNVASVSESKLPEKNPALLSSPSPNVPTSVTSGPEDSNPPKSVAVESAVFSPPTSTSVPAISAFQPNVTVSSAAQNSAGGVVAPFSFDLSKANSTFGQASEAPSLFGAAPKDATTAFGQPAISQSTFGQSAPNPVFGQAAGGFFSQVPAFGASSTTADSSSQNAFSFGKSTSGQSSSGTFGLAKSLFGSTPTSPNAQPTPTNISFGQQSTSKENVFGQGSFFSGLGGKPSEENANKNVFGFSSSVKPANNNIFGSAANKTFGAKSGTFGGGSFSSGGGSVAQSGFGSFQQTPQKSGAFVAAPVFGGSPAFGSPPTFGSTSPFGSGNALSSVFGSPQQQPQANFSNFASASSPTFGSLASQSSGFGNSGGSFGSFGSSFEGGSFGRDQPAGFGSPSSPSSNSSAFTQWRN